jgi:hypothetical protein
MSKLKRIGALSTVVSALTAAIIFATAAPAAASAWSYVAVDFNYGSALVCKNYLPNTPYGALWEIRGWVQTYTSYSETELYVDVHRPDGTFDSRMYLDAKDGNQKTGTTYASALLGDQVTVAGYVWVYHGAGLKAVGGRTLSNMITC